MLPYRLYCPSEAQKLFKRPGHELPAERVAFREGNGSVHHTLAWRLARGMSMDLPC